VHVREVPVEGQRRSGIEIQEIVFASARRDQGPEGNPEHAESGDGGPGFERDSAHGEWLSVSSTARWGNFSAADWGTAPAGAA
jgi:hypothetical protein